MAWAAELKAVEDGSYFNDCAYMETFDPDQPEARYVAENFGEIERVSGSYQYREDAING